MIKGVKHIIILETNRLIIREFEFSDTKLLFLYSQEDAAKKELPDEVLSTLDAAKEKIKFFKGQYENGNILVYAIELKEAGVLIGHVSLSPIKEGMEIGYAIAAAYQRKRLCI